MEGGLDGNIGCADNKVLGAISSSFDVVLSILKIILSLLVDPVVSDSSTSSSKLRGVVTDDKLVALSS
jgi:hypothetical protein